MKYPIKIRNAILFDLLQQLLKSGEQKKFGLSQLKYYINQDFEHRANFRNKKICKLGKGIISEQLPIKILH